MLREILKSKPKQKENKKLIPNYPLDKKTTNYTTDYLTSYNSNNIEQSMPGSPVYYMSSQSQRTDNTNKRQMPTFNNTLINRQTATQTNYTNDNIINSENIEQPVAVASAAVAAEPIRVESRCSNKSGNLKRAGSIKSTKSSKTGKTSYKDRLQTLESFITVIKSNVNDKNEAVDKKLRDKEKLQNTVDILSANIKSVNKENKVNSRLKREFDKENERMKFCGEKAYMDSYYMNKELPSLRAEIEEMKATLNQCAEETKANTNSYIAIDREIMMIKDEIQKKNIAILNINKEKEKIKNEIAVLVKHHEALVEKINRIDKASDEFMQNVGMLVQESFQGR